MSIIRRSFFAALIVGAFAVPAYAQDMTNPAPAPAPAPAPQPSAAPAPAPAGTEAPKPKKHVAAKPKPKAKPEGSLKDVVYLDTKDGRVVIQLRPDLAPKNVAQVEQLTKQGFYNGLTFHRVIANFMAQAGAPTGTGAGGSNLPNLPAEFSTSAHFIRGTVGMARTEDQNSANSQFFICYASMPSLDGQYTIIGQVTSGMDVVDKIKKGTGDNGMVTDPDRIVKMEMATDAGPMKKKMVHATTHKPEATAAKKPEHKMAKKTPKPAPQPQAGANPAPNPGGGDNPAAGGAAPAPVPPPPGGGQD